MHAGPGTGGTPALLEFNGMSVARGSTTALQGIDLRIELGENVAIIGPNGSGKSTLIKAVTRECYPIADRQEPTVRILGESSWDVSKLRSMLGIVSSDLQQICERRISGRETVLSGFFSSIGVYPYHEVTSAMECKVDELLESLEITHLADRYMTDMSTGQARRVLIARALAHDPKALILDEPTSSLDPHAARKFLGFLRRVAQASTSIIMVTHHLHDIVPEISRVVMLKDGRLFADGGKEEMLKDDILSELFSMPVEIERKGEYYYLLA